MKPNSVEIRKDKTKQLKYTSVTAKVHCTITNVVTNVQYFVVFMCILTFAVIGHFEINIPFMAQ